jgi:hypothetical protein
MATQSKKNPRNKVMAGVKRLRRTYAMGKKILKEYPVGETYGQNAMAKAAKTYKMPPNRMARIRMFAACYNKSELQDLINLYRKHDRPVHFSYLVKFCSIRNKRERSRFQRRAIVNTWSFNRIQTELLRCYGRQGPALGRRPQMPPDTAGAIAELDRMCRAWRRWHTVLAEDQSKVKKPHFGLNDLPADVRRQLVKATEAIVRLEEVVAAQLNRSRITRQPRSRRR